jgi:hypothetical protein
MPKWWTKKCSTELHSVSGAQESGVKLASSQSHPVHPRYTKASAAPKTPHHPPATAPTPPPCNLLRFPILHRHQHVTASPRQRSSQCRRLNAEPEAKRRDKMVRHTIPGQQPHPRKHLLRPHQLAKMLLFPKNKPPFNRPQNHRVVVEMPVANGCVKFSYPANWHNQFRLSTNNATFRNFELCSSR